MDGDNSRVRTPDRVRTPLLTIGIIFKNEIRCIRRCLDSLRPLREAVPCELIMADTGSTDGSRAIAAEYADQLLDFPWIDDFAAARNAVLDRASGEWFLTVDCDEWLDPDMRELTDFLQNGQDRAALVAIRNYESFAADSPYTDFLALRLFRRTDGARYRNPIHEYVTFDTPFSRVPPALARTILHHDGYAALYNGGDTDKRRRNLDIVRRELEKKPDDLRTLKHFLDLGRREPEYRDLLERAMRLTESRTPGWDSYGVMIFRDALAAAVTLGWPELNAWGVRAEAAAPDAYCLRLDGNFILSSRAAEEGNWAEVLRREAAYLSALGQRDNNPHWQRERLCGALLMDQPRWVQEGKIQLARALAHTGQMERAVEILAELDGGAMEERQTRLGVLLLRELSGAVDAALLRRLAVTAGTDSVNAARWASVLAYAAEEQAKRETVRAADEQMKRETVFAAEEQVERETVLAAEEQAEREAVLAAEKQTEREAVLAAEREAAEAAREEVPTELRQLAEQVRAILSAYPADDPAVAELKRSPLYQSLARFIEG